MIKSCSAVRHKSKTSVWLHWKSLQLYVRIKEQNNVLILSVNIYIYVIFIIDDFGSLKSYFNIKSEFEWKLHFLTEKHYSRVQERTSLTVFVTLTHTVIDPQEIIGRRLEGGVWTWPEKGGVLIFFHLDLIICSWQKTSQ